MPQHDADAAETAVLSVLRGTPIEEAAGRARIAPARLAAAVERYRAAGRAALETRPTEWHQVNIEFAHYPTAERTFRAYLLPSLRGEPVGAWWFVRKYPCWRLRVRPNPDTPPEDTAAHLAKTLDAAVSWGVVKKWWPSLYEPETVAFGGPKGMAIAHDLFHRDSVGVLDYHQHTDAGTDGFPDAKATSLLMATVLLRAAGLEWGEQGDVWGQIEARRSLPDDVPPDKISAMTGPMRRLLTADVGHALDSGPLSLLKTWATGVQQSGRALEKTARQGSLRLGLRGILARHLLFHWNRMGFPTRQQAIWARATRETVLGW
ncbi:bacteriocin biosynthesis protein [Streptomyces carminius]|uniref:Bacteriocin biosynthesis protein n=1 Tax=Streptomyces carminius TaxID=2665496 RepID=A0A2M8LP07_9ACTN|nr:thiopeptide-type bacteriocin biosynthesis protein [Streptomyces carminius]PJE93686.1 bacteriocin biosynthesis protein [Streptomyces carminius]